MLTRELLKVKDVKKKFGKLNYAISFHFCFFFCFAGQGFWKNYDYKLEKKSVSPPRREKKQKWFRKKVKM